MFSEHLRFNFYSQKLSLLFEIFEKTRIEHLFFRIVYVCLDNKTTYFKTVNH